MLVGACAQTRKSLMCCELIVTARIVGSDFHMVMSFAWIGCVGESVVLLCSSCCCVNASGKCLSIQIWHPLFPLFAVALMTWCVGVLKYGLLLVVLVSCMKMML